MMKVKYTNSKDTYGTQTFDNGDSYTGQFKDDKKHGKGILTSLNGRTYDGCWENDIPHGPGVATFPNGKTYTGEYKHGKPFGYGIWKYTDGKSYSGIWKKGQFVNEQNKNDHAIPKIITFLINFFVYGIMISAVVIWILLFLKII